MNELVSLNLSDADPRFMLSRLADFRSAHVDFEGYDIEFDAYGMIASTRNCATDETIELSPVERVCLWEDYLEHITQRFRQRIWEQPLTAATLRILEEDPPVKLGFLLSISGLSEVSPFRRPKIERPCLDESIDLDQITARFPYLSSKGYTIQSLTAELALLLIHTELLDHITPLKREAALVEAAIGLISASEANDLYGDLAMFGAFPPCVLTEIGKHPEAAEEHGHE